MDRTESSDPYNLTLAPLPLGYDLLDLCLNGPLEQLDRYRFRYLHPHPLPSLPLGYDLLDLCLNGPLEKLDRTECPYLLIPLPPYTLTILTSRIRPSVSVLERSLG